MSPTPPFPTEELEQRVARARQEMSARGLAASLISSPENLYYLTGLDHWGFFAPHLLVVPAEGPLWLVTRAMEAPTVQAQTPQLIHSGYHDGEDIAAHACGVLSDLGLGAGRIGLEEEALFLPPRIAYGLADGLPGVTWPDISGLVDDLRLVKSERELAYVRAAARTTEAMLQAALEAARAGVNEREIAAAVHQAMILAGGDYPGFGPFIRSTPTLPQEHVTWQDHVLADGERLFLEMAGCVRRYHAPMGRLLFVGHAPPELDWIRQVTHDAFDAVVATIAPGVTAGAVYQAWQDCVDAAGLAHYQRHHCGYLVGIGFPPSWVGGSKVVGLRRGSPRVLQAGMVMHLLSWLVGSGRGDFFISNTAVVTERGCEVLTHLPREVTVI